MSARDWLAISRQGKELASAAGRLGTPEGRLAQSLAETVEAMAKLGAAEAESLEHELADLRKQIARIKTVHGM